MNHSRVGFIVSKAVGNAVTRNKVKRRMRNVMRQLLATEGLPGPIETADVVIRAFPAAAQASFQELADEIRVGIAAAGKKYQRRSENHA